MEKTTLQKIEERLQELKETVTTWKGFNDAIIGLGNRCAHKPVVIYSEEKIIDILVNRDGMTHEEAQEYYEFNILGCYIGEQTPIIMEAL